LDGVITQIDHGPVALARGQFDPKRSERPHQVRRYGLQPPATVSDTPSDRVAHHRQPRFLRPSPTPLAPVQKDLFHARVPLSFIRDVFDVIRDTPHHTYQVLTKRSLRLRRVAAKLDWPANLWVGVSVEDSYAVYRVDHLREVPASVRFLSCEPLLGSLAGINLGGIHWVIAGGESGPNYRPMEPRWAREIRDACRDADVAFFFKQWGGRTPKSLGRTLDGQLWEEMPPATAVPSRGS
jgi:protein gp37